MQSCSRAVLLAVVDKIDTAMRVKDVGHHDSRDIDSDTVHFMLVSVMEVLSFLLERLSVQPDKAQ